MSAERKPIRNIITNGFIEADEPYSYGNSLNAPKVSYYLSELDETIAGLILNQDGGGRIYLSNAQAKALASLLSALAEVLD